MRGDDDDDYTPPPKPAVPPLLVLSIAVAAIVVGVLATVILLYSDSSAEQTKTSKIAVAPTVTKSNTSKQADSLRRQQEEEERKKREDKPTPKPPEKEPVTYTKVKGIGIYSIAVGQEGPAYMSVKVLQVLDENRMLVTAQDPRTGTGNLTVMVKAHTKGIVDGRFFGQGWDQMIGSDYIRVTGTTTYKTTDGGSKTVFVIEAAAKPK